MRSFSSERKIQQFLFLALIVLFACGMFSPQLVLARVYVERGMPVCEGDPTDGLDYGGGGDGTFTPPDDGDSTSANRKCFYSFNIIPFDLGNGFAGIFYVPPQFGCKSLDWTETVVPVLGGSN